LARPIAVVREGPQRVESRLRRPRCIHPRTRYWASENWNVPLMYVGRCEAYYRGTRYACFGASRNRRGIVTGDSPRVQLIRCLFLDGTQRRKAKVISFMKTYYWKRYARQSPGALTGTLTDTLKFSASSTADAENMMKRYFMYGVARDAAGRIFCDPGGCVRQSGYDLVRCSISNAGRLNSAFP